MAKQGNANQIGEANVRITGDISDLKAKVAEAKKDVDGVGDGTSKRGRRAGTISDERRSTGGEPEGLSTLATLRRALGIGAFIAGITATFFKLGQSIREAITSQRTLMDAQIESGRLLSKSAEEEAAARQKISEELSAEIAGFREGSLVERILYQIGQASRGRSESTLERIRQDNSDQQVLASNRLAQERTKAELAKQAALLQRILDALENMRDQQRQASDRALAQQQVASARLEEIVGIRANAQRR